LFVYYTLRWMGVRPPVSAALALIAMVASPAVLSRVVMDTQASGPVTERAMVLSTLGALYALTLVSARAGVMHRPTTTLSEALFPVAVVLGVSFVIAGLLALALRMALRVMSPTSENTSMLLIALIAAGTALAAHFGGSAPLAALLGGILLKQLNPRPWAWPRQLGTAASLLTMLMFVLVSVVAAKADWNPAVAGLVAALVLARGVAKVLGVGAANWGSGTSWRQAFWTGCAMSPMSSVALLLVQQFVSSSLTLGPRIASIALPAILLMEVLGAIIATFAIYRVGESSRPLPSEGASITQPGDLRG
jgi:Kef-type K+ transport system membrane component KefB